MLKKLVIDKKIARWTENYMDVLHQLCDYMDANRVDDVTFTLDGVESHVTIAQVVHAHYYMKAQNLIMKSLLAQGELQSDMDALEKAYRNECKCRRIDASATVIAATWTTATF